MKKLLLCLLLSTSAAVNLKAQTFSEWFNQKQTQTKYLIQQVAALQVYIGYAKKGYDIAKEGLNTIDGFTRGEFDLHADYINSLKSVNPDVKRYIRVAEIVSLQRKIVENYSRIYRQVNSSNALSSEELAYIRGVFSRLLDDCDSVLDELITITTDGKLEMKDDERLARIDRLYLDMLDKLTFSQSFASDAKLFAASRLKERSDLQSVRALHHLKTE